MSARSRTGWPLSPHPVDTLWDQILFLVIGLLLAAGGLVWATGQVAGLLFGQAWIDVDLAELVGVLTRLSHCPGDPAEAWPPQAQAELPGPIGMYLSLALIVAALAAAAVVVLRLRERGLGGGRRREGARWATGWQLRALRVRCARPGRVVLGRAGLGRLLAAEDCQSVLVFGPPGSYKTTGLVVPTILEWVGPLVANSIKPDVLRATLAQREQRGEVWIYDPLGCSGFPASQWTPLASCWSWRGALAMAEDLAAAADLSGYAREDQNYWTTLGTKLLAPLLFAAARTDRTMTDVVRWLDTQETAEVDQALEEAGDPIALDGWNASKRREDKTKGSVYGTAETLLKVFADPRVADSAKSCDLNLDDLLSGEHTLYLYAPVHEQRFLRPLLETLTNQVLRRAQELAARQPDGMLPNRLLVCLDEAGNAGAFRDLPELATTARGQGIQLVTVWHDQAQLDRRCGGQAATVLNGHRAKLFLGGLADTGSLGLASALIGDEARDQTSRTAGDDGRSSIQTSTTYRRLMPLETLRQLRPGEAVLLYGHLPPARIRLRPWFADRGLRRLAVPLGGEES